MHPGATISGSTQSVLSEGASWENLSYQELSTRFNIKD